MMEVSFEEFQKLDLRVGKIVSAEPVEGSSKLLKLKVDLGTEHRQILAGIQEFYEPKDLLGKNFTFIVNLEPRKMVGLESQGMMLCADTGGQPVCLAPIGDVPAGSKIR